jgi:hypothetical protein
MCIPRTCLQTRSRATAAHLGQIFCPFPNEFKGCGGTLTPLVLVRIQVPQPTKPRKSQRKSSSPPGRRLQNSPGVCSCVLRPFRRMQTKRGEIRCCIPCFRDTGRRSTAIANAGRHLALAPRRYGPRGVSNARRAAPKSGTGRPLQLHDLLGFTGPRTGSLVPRPDVPSRTQRFAPPRPPADPNAPMSPLDRASASNAAAPLRQSVSSWRSRRRVLEARHH